VVAGVVLTLLLLAGSAFAFGMNGHHGAHDFSNGSPRSMMSLAGGHHRESTWMDHHQSDVRWMRAHHRHWSWMRDHPMASRWMRNHHADLTWMRDHRHSFAWMRTHHEEWRP